jgi:cathepsin L
MKAFCSTICLAATAAASASLLPETMNFGDWRVHFDAHPAKAGLTFREGVFNRTLAFIEAHNAQADAGQQSYRVGVNKFSDLTSAEFKALYLRPLRPRASAVREVWIEGRDGAADDSIDWRTKGAVTPVKDQGQCGSVSARL